MQRKRSELVPIAEAFSDLSGPVAALRDASPQALQPSPPARRGFTRFDQVNQLVAASEADPDHRLHGANDGAVQPASQQPR